MGREANAASLRRVGALETLASGTYGQYIKFKHDTEQRFSAVERRLDAVVVAHTEDAAQLRRAILERFERDTAILRRGFWGRLRWLFTGK